MYIDRLVTELVTKVKPGSVEELTASAAISAVYNRFDVVRRTIMAKQDGMPYIKDPEVRGYLQKEDAIYDKERSLALLDARCAFLQNTKLKLEGVTTTPFNE